MTRLVSGFIFVALSLALHSVAQADRSAELKKQTVSTFEFFRGLYRAEYAPAAWKGSLFHWSLDKEVNYVKGLTVLSPDLTVPGVRPLVNRFISSMRDYHVSVSFIATERATLPMSFKSAGDRVFLAFVDRSQLSKQKFPFSEGDELISFDGRPAIEVVKELQALFVENQPGTDRALATAKLTARAASQGVPVPKGPVVLGFQTPARTTKLVQLEWKYSPELISGGPFDRRRFRTKIENSILRPMVMIDLDEPANPSPVIDPNQLGARKTFTPDLGRKIWESESSNPFYAYTFRRPSGKRIGYLRLPTYAPKDTSANAVAFGEIIRRFEAETDLLIVDQVNNPGGSVNYLYALVSMLTNKPAKTPHHQMALDQAIVRDALREIAPLKAIQTDEQARAILGNDINGYPVDLQFARLILAQVEFMVSEWNAGRRLTKPFFIGGVDEIQPAPAPYTKPILLLVNSLDFSGGDFFPAILQDAGRAVIFGSRTSGAGGYVREVAFPNNIGVERVRITGSLAHRSSGKPIENLGIKPDIAYEITPKDLSNQYVDYVSAVLKTADAMARSARFRR